MSTTEPRISLFVPNLEGGGAERVMISLARNFCEIGLNVDLVLQKARGPYLKEVYEGVRVVDLGASRLALSLWPLIRYIRRNRPDAMLSTPLDANLVATLAWTVARARGRLVVREAITATEDNAVAIGARSRLLAATRRKVYERANHVVAPSIGVAEDLIRNIGIERAHVSVIPNPLDTERITALASAPIEGVAVPGDVPVVLGIGRLSTQKDFATLIRAFAKVCQTRKAILVILGEGSERIALTRLATEMNVYDSVMMPGFVENPFPYLRRAAVFVLASRYEGLPNSLLQALTIETPVVATDCPSGPREILEGGRWGRLVPVGDADSMAASIIDALDGHLDRPPLSLVSERYGVETIASQYLEALLPGFSEKHILPQKAPQTFRRSSEASA